MNQRIDQSGDLNHDELVKYAQLYEFPDFVKTAGVDSLCTPPQQSPNFFADARDPFQFPCHSPAATVVSQVFFLNKQAEINPKIRPLIQQRLDHFSSYWRVKGATDLAKKRHAELHKEADVPDSAYALVQIAGNQKYRQHPVRNGLEVKAAALWFREYLPQLREEFPFPDRQKIAAKILKKAEDLGVKLDDVTEAFLEKSAGHGMRPASKIAESFRNRVVAADRCKADVAQAMNKMAELVENKPQAFLEPNVTSGLAKSLDEFDREHGLLNKYSELLLSPEDAVFGVTYKQANAAIATACTTLTGSVYDKTEFSKLAFSDVADAFGDDIARQVARGLKIDAEKMAEFAATLPLNDAKLLDALMASKGVAPLLKESSAYGLTPAEYATIVGSK